jgi:hypothetical protein
VIHPGLAEPRTKEQWRAYLHATPPPRPILPPYDQYTTLERSDRERLDMLRQDHHSALVIVRSERMRALHHVIARRMAVNSRQAAGARRGIVIDGSPTNGKSTLVKMFGYDFEHDLRRTHPQRFQPGHVIEGHLVDYTPVVYLSIPSQATPKDLSIQLADYLAMPYRPGATKNEITRCVLETLRLCGSELVIIDDVHFLDLSIKEGKVANDHLKYLANHCAATFVYTGHHLEDSGLFLEGRAADRATQTSGRNSLHRLDRFRIGTERELREWIAVIMAMEDHLVLYRHQSGTLAKLYRYLHERTDGSISALSDLIRESAVEAVWSGQEAISKSLMDTVVISKQAETAYQKTRQRRTSVTTRATTTPKPPRSTSSPANPDAADAC